MNDSAHESGLAPRNADIEEYLQQLVSKSGAIFEHSMTPENSPKVAASFVFVREIEIWCNALEQRREVELLRVAALEHTFALLALTEGNYRHAFRGLRLVLELILQSVYLSANELLLRDWLENRADTVWDAITDENEGVFSYRFARAFFPELANDVQDYRKMAAALYRECSECVHGNTPKSIPLPACLEFDQGAFDLWHSKASIVAMTAHFALSLRYLLSVSEVYLSDLEHFLSDRLGHLEEVRKLLGGPSKG